MRPNFANNYIYKDSDVEKKKYSGSGVYASFLTPTQFDTLAQADWQSAADPIDISKLGHFYYASNLMRGFDFDDTGKKKMTVEDFVGLDVFKTQTLSSAPSDNDCLIRDGKPWMNPIMKLAKAIFATAPSIYPTSSASLYFDNIIISAPAIKPSYGEGDFSFGGFIEFSFSCQKAGTTVYFEPIRVSFEFYDLLSDKTFYVNYFFYVNIQAQIKTGADEWDSLYIGHDPSLFYVSPPFSGSIGSPMYLPVMVKSPEWHVSISSGDLDPLLTALNAEFDPSKFNDEYRYLASVVDIREEDI
jgi:hypothetical protein